MEKQDCTRVSLNLSTQLVKKIDDYAKSMNVNRTSAICFLINNQFSQLEAIKAINKASSLIEQ